jgi:hypothetical protein
MGVWCEHAVQETMEKQMFMAYFIIYNHLNCQDWKQSWEISLKVAGLYLSLWSQDLLNTK